MAKYKEEWQCPCGAVKKFDAFAAAHWRDLVSSSCDCGRISYLRAGCIVRTIQPKGKRRVKATV